MVTTFIIEKKINLNGKKKNALLHVFLMDFNMQ